MANGKKLSFKDWVTLAISVLAFGISVYNFIEAHSRQHVLKASVFLIDSSDNKLNATLLVVNGGKNYETLYRARFIFSNDLSKSGGSMSDESVGPVVLKPGEMVVLNLQTAMPDIQKFREDGTIKDLQSGIHLGVDFLAVQPNGELTENDKIYRVTELKYNGTQRAGQGQRPSDTKELIDLLD